MTLYDACCDASYYDAVRRLLRRVVDYYLYGVFAQCLQTVISRGVVLLPLLQHGHCAQFVGTVHVYVYPVAVRRCCAQVVYNVHMLSTRGDNITDGT